MTRLDRILLTLALMGAAGPALADPATLTIAALTASGVSVSATAAFAIRVGFAIAMTALSQALTKGAANANGAPKGITLRSTTGGEQTPQSFILGRYITAGNLTAPEMSHGADGDTRYLTRVIDLSDVQVTALEALIIDGVRAELATGTPATLNMSNGDGTTPAIHPDYGPTVNRGDFIGFAWCRFKDGSQTSADAMLLDKYGTHPARPWESTMVGRGVAYAVLTFLWRDSPQVWQGSPDVRFIVQGIRLYDPRKDTTAGGSGAHRYGTTSTHEWSDNPVVMIYNLLRGIQIRGGAIFGGGFAAADLPYATWAAAMNACDVLIGDRKTYTAGYEVFMGGSDAGGQSPADVVEELLKACSGQIADVGGTLYIRVGAPGLPVKFITDDDILVTQGQELDPFPGAEDSYNIVHATWVNPSQLWTVKEATPVRDQTAINADGQELVADIALPAVTVGQQVQQLMSAWLKDAQRHRRQTITLPPEGILLKPLDVIDWTSERNGYSGKAFEIGQVGIDPQTLCTTLSMREIDPSDYDWSTGQEIVIDAPSIDPVINAAQTVPGFAATATTIKDESGVDRLPAIRLEWLSLLPGVTSIRFQIRVNGTNTVAVEGSTANVDVGYHVVSAGIVAGVAYQARARLVGPKSTVWTSWVAVTAPDVRIKEIDLADEVQTLLAEAEIVRQEGQQLVADLRAEVDTEFAIEIPRVADVEQAISTIATQVTWLTALAAQTEKNVADAGLYIDPLTGKARLEGVASVEDKVNAVSVTLDAQAAQIALRVTQADVDLAIAAAQLDPTELPIITGLEGRVTDLEVSLDAAEAAILQRATVVDFDALGTEVSEATIRIDALEAEIVQKVETSDFSALESRVTTAEVTLSALDGAGLTIQVADIRQDLRLVDGLADMTLEQIANLHQEQLGRLADTALVRQEYSALVTDEREARASLRTELAAAIDANLATALQEIAVVASETDAQATLITQLTATVNANTAAITSEAIARATEDEALAGQLDSIEVTVAENTSAITIEQAVRASADSAQATLITQLTATVISNTAAITSEAAARASADSALSTTLSTVQATTNANTAAITNEAAARTNADSALATQINSVSATANATAATVSIQQSAIATLEGNAEASLVLRSRAGGASGEIEIVAADDPVSGPSSVVKIKSDRFQFIGDLAEFLGSVKITGDLVLAGSLTRSLFANGQLQAALYPARIEFVTSSDATWSPKLSGLMQVWVFGAGGGGGAAGDNGSECQAAGGGAGGLSIGFVPNALTSQTYTLAVGAGGAGGNPGDNDGADAGNNGGLSRFTGNGVTFTGNGGSGGRANRNSTDVLAGGAGGTASGGSYNYTGGDGGDVNLTATGHRALASPGGAPFAATGSSGAGPNQASGGVSTLGGLLTPTGGRTVPSGFGADLEVSGFPMRGYDTWIGGSARSESPTNAASGNVVGGAGAIGCGGGGGACRRVAPNSNWARGGAGGDGLIVVVYYRVGNFV
jgi:hypothetical protein